MIEGLTNTGAMPTLEAVLRFAGERQRLIAHNIANLSTPDFQPRDVSVEGFQKALAGAIDRRRERTGGTHGALGFEGTREVRVGRGRLELRPDQHAGGVLAHDRNARDLERTMQDMVENASVYRVAADLLRAQKERLHAAIGERVV
jgi:flagellar basal-body rod protein FlgB